MGFGRFEKVLEGLRWFWRGSAGYPHWFLLILVDSSHLMDEIQLDCCCYFSSETNVGSIASRTGWIDRLGWLIAFLCRCTALNIGPFPHVNCSRRVVNRKPDGGRLQNRKCKFGNDSHRIETIAHRFKSPTGFNHKSRSRAISHKDGTRSINSFAVMSVMSVMSVTSLIEMAVQDYQATARFKIVGLSPLKPSIIQNVIVNGCKQSPPPPPPPPLLLILSLPLPPPPPRYPSQWFHIDSWTQRRPASIPTPHFSTRWSTFSFVPARFLQLGPN